MTQTIAALNNSNKGNAKVILVPKVSVENELASSKTDDMYKIKLNGMRKKSSLCTDSSENLKMIECRVEFVTLGEVDTFREQFKAHVLVRSRWMHQEKITSYDPKQDWNPKLFLENLIPEKFYEEVKYKLVQVDDRTEITEIRSCKGTFWERMELPDFPLDIQELSIIIQTRHNPRNVKLIPDSQRLSRLNSETLNSFRDQQKFKLYKMVRTSQTASYDMSNNSLNVRNKSDSYTKRFPKRSKFVASCFCSRNPGYYITNVFSFNFLIAFLSLTLFVIDVESAAKRITGTFKLILTLFTFKIVTSKALPTISYLTSLDKYQLINIVYLAMCCVWHSTLIALNVDNVSKNQLDKIAVGALIGFLFSVQVTFGYMFFKSYQKTKILENEEISFVKRISNYPYDLEEYDDDT